MTKRVCFEVSESTATMLAALKATANRNTLAKDIDKLLESYARKSLKTQGVSVHVKSGEACSKCDGTLVLRKSKDREFLGCSNYPKCKFTKNVK